MSSDSTQGDKTFKAIGNIYSILFRIQILILIDSLSIQENIPRDRHLVGGECAGLVRADDRCASQSLYRGQGPDDGVLLGHTAGTQSKTGGDDSGKTFRDGSYSEGHSNLEVVHGTLHTTTS